MGPSEEPLGGAQSCTQTMVHDGHKQGGYFCCLRTKKSGSHERAKQHCLAQPAHIFFIPRGVADGADPAAPRFVRSGFILVQNEHAKTQ
jgi:hypothetical protein